MKARKLALTMLLLSACRMPSAPSRPENIHSDDGRGKPPTVTTPGEPNKPAVPSNTTTNLTFNPSKDVFYSIPFEIPAMKVGNQAVVDVAVVGDTIFASTLAGMSVSKDGGKTWVTKNKKRDFASDAVWNIYSSGKFICAGGFGGLSCSKDGGQTWFRRGKPDGLMDDSVIGSFYDGKRIFAATQDGFYMSQNEGKTWKVKNFPEFKFSNKYLDVCVNATSIYVVGVYGLAVSKDEGETWTEIKLEPFKKPEITDISCTDKLYVINEKRLYSSVDSGITWKLLSTPDLPELESLTIDGKVIYAPTATGYVKTSDEGLTWSKVKAGTEARSPMPVRMAVKDAKIFFTGMDGLFISNDSGSTWINIPPLLEFDLEIDAFPAKSIDHTEDAIFAVTSKALLVGNIDGTMWETKTLATTGDLSSMVVHRKAVYVGTEANGVMRTADKGASWKEQSITKTAGEKYGKTVKKLASGDQALLAMDSTSALMSIDEGETWRVIESEPGKPVENVRAIAAVKSTLLVATMKGLYLSNDDGKTWTLKNVSSGLRGDELFSVFASESVIAVTARDAISMSKDGGVSWSNKVMPQGLTSVPNILELDGLNIFVSIEQGLLGSLDGGETWSLSSSENGHESNNIQAVSKIGKSLFVASFGGLCVSNPNFPVQ